MIAERMKRFGFRDGISVLLAAAIALTARASFADHYVVPSGSMEPTVDIDDHVIVNKMAYGIRVPLTQDYAVRFSGPSRGEVVVLTSPESGIVLLKRVIAVPGDRVTVRDGKIELNGERAPITWHGDNAFESLGARDHRLDLNAGGGPDFGPEVVPPDRYLVMGDHRGDSHDGRDFGFVEGSAILGRVTAVVIRGGHVVYIPL
jgi:signal peptidase I